MLIWDDSDGDGEIHHVTKDSYYVQIDRENGVLRIADHETNESRTTTMLFIGPNATANSEKWNEFVARLGDPTDVNTKTAKFLHECFKD